MTDLLLQKRRLLDEGTGREVTAGTVLTVMIQYELGQGHSDGFFSITRVARLTMYGVTDFSIFEQEGADCSEIGMIHAEAAGGRLRFWFDPEGELYVICDEAELEEVSMPSPGRPVPSGISGWTFQATTGDLPGVDWLLDCLDRAGFPCAWRAVKRTGPFHPAWRWEGHLLPASHHEEGPAGLVHVQTYGPLDGCGFGITLRALDPRKVEAARLLMVLAELISSHFEGTCLAGRHLMEGDEWPSGREVSPTTWWNSIHRGGDGLSQDF